MAWNEKSGVDQDKARKMQEGANKAGELPGWAKSVAGAFKGLVGKKDDEMSEALKRRQAQKPRE